MLLLSVCPQLASAQRVLGPFDDASVLPKGMVRASVSPTWGRAHERFADGAGRTPKGSVEPFAADFDLDTLGAAHLPAVGAVRAGLGQIVGTNGAAFALSLGRLSTRIDATTAFTPIVLEFGLTSRLTIGGMLPMVKTRAEVAVNMNPGGATGTIGLNPGFANGAVRVTNLTLVSQINAAIQQLQGALTSCVGSTDPSCTAINANRPRAQQLVTAATQAAGGIESVYGVSTTKPGARFAPVERSAVHLAVTTRLTALSNEFLALLGAPAGSAWIAGTPVGAAPFAYAALQRVLADTAFGIEAEPFQSIEISRFGDMEAGLKYLVFDSFNAQAPGRTTPGGVKLRVAVAAVYRFGIAQWDSADDFADISTGDSQDDIEGRVFADVLLGRRFWTSLVARYAVQRPDAQFFRVPLAAHLAFAPLSRRVAVQRDLGDLFTLEASPRLVLGDHVALAASYVVRRKGADEYAALEAPRAGQTAVDPAVLATGTEQTEQRVFASVTYSTMAQYFRRKATWPMEVSLVMGRSVRGQGVAKQMFSGLSFRFYNQLFGK